ncbi:MAG: TRAP transporter small permease subunit [Planktomarina sp.]|nr:TRAP transporter small permease subunit [Planktomarina sp.]
MTMPDQMAEGLKRVDSSLFIRAISWSLLALLAAFLTNNILELAFDVTTELRFNNPVPVLVYIISIVVAILYTFQTPRRSLRADGEAVHKFNVFLIRSVFWGVFLVGVADVAVAFMRVENLADVFFWEGAGRDFNKPFFVGMYIHIPLLVLGFFLGAVTRTLGFIWLAILIVIAELLIVVSRFVFSYEQAFMGDLVRFWYAALFLLSSAYTLYDEGHVRVDIVFAGMRERSKGITNFVGTLLLGLTTCWVILLVGMNGKQSIINSPIMNFEISQTASIGMFVKYQMAGFLGVFAITMYIQFVSYLMSAWADIKGEPGKRIMQQVGY